MWENICRNEWGKSPPGITSTSAIPVPKEEPSLTSLTSCTTRAPCSPSSYLPRAEERRGALFDYFNSAEFANGVPWPHLPILHRSTSNLVQDSNNAHTAFISPTHISPDNMDNASTFWIRCQQTSEASIAGFVALNALQHEQNALTLRIMQSTAHLVTATFRLDVGGQERSLDDIRSLLDSIKILVDIDVDSRSALLRRMEGRDLSE